MQLQVAIVIGEANAGIEQKQSICRFDKKRKHMDK